MGNFVIGVGFLEVYENSNNLLRFFLLLQRKPPGLKEMQAPFLYGILVKRSELSAAMFTPTRLLLRLGYDMNSKLFL